MPWMDMVASLSLCDEPNPPRRDLPQTQRESLPWARSSPSEGRHTGSSGHAGFQWRPRAFRVSLHCS